MRALLREPLLHFLAFGALVVGVQSLRGGGEEVPVVEEDPRIVVDAALRADLRGQLTEALGRPPTEAEQAAAVDRWVQTEVLVREARRLGLDRDDPVIRARLARKMTFVTQAVTVPPEPTEAELRELYTEEAEELRVPTRLTVRQLYVDGRARQAEAEALAMRWRAGEDPRQLGEEADAAPGGPVLRMRTPEHLARQLGAVGEAMAELDGEEIAVLPGEAGWHVVRVLARDEGGVLSFEDARERLVVRWKARWLAAATEQAVEELVEEHEVVGWP